MVIGITGSKGFIGSFLVRRVFYGEVTRVRVLLRNVANHNFEDDVEVFQGDLLSRQDCERFAAGVDVIYHLAHCNTPLNSDEDQADDALLNLIPTLNLLQSIRKLGTRPHVVYFSSGGAVYGPNLRRIPFRETDPCNPSCSYGIQKLAAEHYLRIAAESGFLTATVLRAGNAYGTLLSQYRKQGLIGVAILQVLHGKPIRVFGSPDNVRDYVHLKDVGVMAKLAQTARQPFAVFNVGSGQGHSVAEVLRVIEEVNQAPIQVAADKTLETRLTDWAVLDVSKAAEEFGWTPGISLRAGIEEMVAVGRDELQQSSAMAR
jgi:UDP-glucose 4-epimerase